MKIVRTLGVLKRQIVYSVAAVALLLSVALPSLVSADQLTGRSVELSSAATSATAVDYTVAFSATDTTAGAVVVQFCSNTPLIGEYCNAPTGFNAASATATGATMGTKSANQVIVTMSVAASNSFTINNVANPTTAGTIYARILTYADATAAASYNVTSSSSALGSPKDQGSVAIAIADKVNVSGAVLESLTFCTSGGQDDAHPEINPITAGCGGSLTAPTLKLGKVTGTVVALDSADVYTGTIYTQLSTNAVSGAVIRLKSSAANCGGLVNSSSPAKCDIAPAGASGDVAAGQAKFGLKLGADVSGAGGTLQAAGNYDSTHYRLNYVDNTSGVTSTYGDSILDTDSGSANSLDMPLTFGASVAPNTPAGNYSADLSLIATGTF